MCADSSRPDQPGFDDSLVLRLIAAQFPRWDGLPVRRIDSAGTSNVMYRLGGDMVVRLPRTAGAAEDVEKEHTWLPRLAPSLPLAVPVPLGMGAPDEGCPWPWSVYRWIDGEIPAVGAVAEPRRLATDLARFVTALHRIDPADGPPSYRGEPLAARDAETRAAIAAVRGAVDPDAAEAAWDEALRAPDPDGPPVWIHADLQPGNMLLARDRLCAVIDFGCLGLGDPAVDLLAAWYVVPDTARPLFRTALNVDDATWARGRGWALSVALMELSHYRDTNPFMARVARHVITEILHDHSTTQAGIRRR
ncbi:aminoglycoside phosphotransferase family protein [Streptomyces sp. NPDC056817]|uniref:aminoglycoside phosphotransferase family protein n=1 Tax=Streptomyces sp. NPDC056817 TaxID=3345950 RepID=UPI0036CAA377